MQKITPFLWFDGRAEEAMNYYTSLFKNSKTVSLSRFGEGGSVVIGTFEIEGLEFMVLDGGPMHAGFTPAVSFMVHCEDQAEVDYLYDNIAAEGMEQACGWVSDKFGLSWQIIPTALGRLMSDPDPEKAGRVAQAMFQMKKIIVKDLEDAHAGL